MEIGDTVRIGYFMQENEPLDEKMTVLEFVRSIGEYVTTATGKATASQMCEKFLFGPKSQWTPISKLSGGERQRISIARALLKDAPIVLLDEATASLDVENETVVQQALSRLLAGKTVIVIAHRMRTVENADKIVVLKDGVVAEQGTPAQLKAAGGEFARMVALQKEAAAWQL